MKYSEVETPQKLIEDMCGDWDWEVSIDKKIDHLDDIMLHIEDLRSFLPNSHLKEYLGELHEELGHEINSYSEI